MEKKVISIFALVCLALVVYLWFNPRIEYETVIETVVKEEVRYETIIDTLYIIKADTIEVQVLVPDTLESGINRYRNPVQTDYFTGVIESMIRGELVSQTFDYEFKSEQITRIDSVIVEREITNTITRTVYPSGLYFGLQSFDLGTNASVGPSLMFVRRQNAFGYSYDPFNNTHNLNIHFRW